MKILIETHFLSAGMLFRFQEPSVDPQPPKTTAHSCEKEQQTTGAEICNNLDDPTFFEKEIESDEDISKKVTQTTLNGVINTCICDEKSVSNDIVMEHIQSTSILVETKVRHFVILS